jgi:hypothetical protein
MPDAQLWSDDILVAVEITSSDDDVDFNDKRAEYAAQAIPAYLIVVMDAGGIDSIEEYRLDRSGRNYQLTAVHRNSLVTELPAGMKIDVSFTTLEQMLARTVMLMSPGALNDGQPPCRPQTLSAGRAPLQAGHHPTAPGPWRAASCCLGLEDLGSPLP